MAKAESRMADTPCGYTYSDGRVCKGTLFVYSRSRRGVPYIMCTEKSNHGMSVPGNALPPSYWGYSDEDFDGDPGLPP